MDAVLVWVLIIAVGATSAFALVILALVLFGLRRRLRGEDEK